MDAFTITKISYGGMATLSASADGKKHLYTQRHHGSSLSEKLPVRNLGTLGSGITLDSFEWVEPMHSWARSDWGPHTYGGNDILVCRYPQSKLVLSNAVFAQVITTTRKSKNTHLRVPSSLRWGDVAPKIMVLLLGGYKTLAEIVFENHCAPQRTAIDGAGPSL